MIERINTNSTNDMGSVEINRLIRLPKNIRQIGMADNDKRIYIEDYVITFIKTIKSKSHGQSNRRNMFILVGTTGPVENVNATFVSGAILLDENDRPNEKGMFISFTWEKIYRVVKEYFSTLEIVGWAITDNEWDGADNAATQIHLQNFAGQDKLLYTYNSYEKEEAIYKYVANTLRKQRGFFIYYDKNEAMQTYMLNLNGSKSIETEYVDETATKIRAVAIKASEKTSSAYGRGHKKNESSQKEKESSQKEKDLITQKGESGKNFIFSTAIIAVAMLLVALKINGNQLNQEVVVASLEPTTQVLAQVKSTTLTFPPEATKIAENLETTKAPVKSKAPEDDGESKKTQDAMSEVSAKREYVVKEGDTLASISYRMYGTIFNVDKIKKANNIDDDNVIVAGTTIIIPQ